MRPVIKARVLFGITRTSSCTTGKRSEVSRKFEVPRTEFLNNNPGGESGEGILLLGLYKISMTVA